MEIARETALLIAMEQRSKEWFEARKGKVTGSMVGAILGKNPWMSAEDAMRTMVRDYHNAEKEFTGNVATEYGTQFESYAQGDFEMESGLNVNETGFHVHPDLDWLGASPDGLIDDDAVLEIKCPYGKRDSNEFSSIYEQPHYYAQTQIEMFCTGRKKTYFYQWSSKGSRLETVDFSQVWIDENLPILNKFYDRYLDEISNEKHLVDLVQSKDAQDQADRYRKAREVLDVAKKEMEAAKKELIEIAGGKKTNVSGLLVYPINKKGSVKYAQVVKEHLPELDLTPYMGKASKSWGIK